jgi:hypothetical protein
VASYRVVFVDREGQTFDAVEFERATDDAAIIEAHRLNIPSMGAGFDLWRQGRLVHKHRRAVPRGAKSLVVGAHHIAHLAESCHPLFTEFKPTSDDFLKLVGALVPAQLPQAER